ncbi:MAG: carbohydrate ABC transporter permease [Chloroflexota bacterium]
MTAVQSNSRMTMLRQDKRFQAGIWSVLSYIGLVIFLVLWLFPVFWMVVTSIKPNREITANVAPLGVVEPTVRNFTYLFERSPDIVIGDSVMQGSRNTQFLRWSWNSLFVSATTTLLSVVAGTMAAYALVRYALPGRGAMGLGIFITYLLPQTLLFIPMTLVVRQLGLYDNLWALVLVYPTMMVPFCTWLMMGYFRAIPSDMENSARVDGATRWQAFYKVALPLARPGIISASIFTFTLSWSEFLYALVLMPSSANQTIPIGVPNALSSGDVFIWGSLMAAALLGSLPVVLVYAFFMRYFVSGMMVGAVKG